MEMNIESDRRVEALDLHHRPATAARMALSPGPAAVERLHRPREDAADFSAQLCVSASE